MPNVVNEPIVGNPNLATKKQGRKTGATLENRAVIQKAIRLKKKHPNMSYEEIGKQVGRHKSSIKRALERYGFDWKKSEQYKDHRADILAGMQNQVLESMANDDLSKVSFRDKTVSFGILYDKEERIRGVSGKDDSLSNIVEIVDKKQRTLKDEQGREITETEERKIIKKESA